MPKVKICCIQNLEEARMAISYGAHALGLVGPMPSGPGIISNEDIRKIADYISSETETFLLTSESEVDKIIAHHRKVKTSAIQLVDGLSKGTHGDLKSALPEIKIVQVIHVSDSSSVEEALKLSTAVDYILLDSGNPNLAVKELGGTGRVHNWELSRQIVEHAEIPVFLAGGLNAENVRKAIFEVKPYGLDLCTGVRINGQLNEKKLQRFFENIRSSIY